jgi:hypothetical protein
MKVILYNTNSEKTVVEAEDFDRIQYIDDDGSLITESTFKSLKKCKKRDVEEFRKRHREFTADSK